MRHLLRRGSSMLRAHLRHRNRSAVVRLRADLLRSLRRTKATAAWPAEPSVQLQRQLLRRPLRARLRMRSALCTVRSDLRAQLRF
ncbi:MAG: hypothetical protein AAFP90_05630 [Planctomycetota bacterium]